MGTPGAILLTLLCPLWEDLLFSSLPSSSTASAGHHVHPILPTVEDLFIFLLLPFILPLPGPEGTPPLEANASSSFLTWESSYSQNPHLLGFWALPASSGGSHMSFFHHRGSLLRTGQYFCSSLYPPLCFLHRIDQHCDSAQMCKLGWRN